MGSLQIGTLVCEVAGGMVDLAEAVVIKLLT